MKINLNVSVEIEQEMVDSIIFYFLNEIDDYYWEIYHKGLGEDKILEIKNNIPEDDINFLVKNYYQGLWTSQTEVDDDGKYHRACIRRAAQILKLRYISE